MCVFHNTCNNDRHNFTLHNNFIIRERRWHPSFKEGCVWAAEAKRVDERCFAQPLLAKCARHVQWRRRLSPRSETASALAIKTGVVDWEQKGGGVGNPLPKVAACFESSAGCLRAAGGSRKSLCI